MEKSSIRAIESIIGLIALLGVLPESRAAAVIVVVESEGDVVFTTQAGSSLDLTGMSLNGSASHSAEILPSSGFFRVGDLQPTQVYFPPAIPLVPFGSGSLAFSTSGAGDVFGVELSGVLLVPSTYNSGDPLDGSATYAGQTFASLGLTPGSYVSNLPNDTITLNIVQTVSIPGLVSLLGAALLCWIGCAALPRHPAAG